VKRSSRIVRLGAVFFDPTSRFTITIGWRPPRWRPPFISLLQVAYEEVCWFEIRTSHRMDYIDERSNLRLGALT